MADEPQLSLIGLYALTAVRSLLLWIVLREVFR